MRETASVRRQAPRNVASILDAARELGIRDAQGPWVARSPPRDALEDDLDACSTDHPVGRPTSLTPQGLGRFVRRECFHHGLLGVMVGTAELDA